MTLVSRWDIFFKNNIGTRIIFFVILSSTSGLCFYFFARFSYWIFLDDLTLAAKEEEFNNYCLRQTQAKSTISNLQGYVFETLENWNDPDNKTTWQINLARLSGFKLGICSIIVMVITLFFFLIGFFYLF